MQNRSLRPDETHWEGSLGQVERTLRPNPTPWLSATPAESNELADRIRQTHMLVTNNKTKADALLREYKRNMGEPFSSQEDNVPKRTIPGLPSPDMPANEWDALSNAQRLRQNYTTYAVIPAHLETVLYWQKDLNPHAGKLLEQLTSVQRDILALLNNLQLLLALVKATPVTPPEASKLTAPSTFEQKVVGYNVCWLYYQWLKRSLKDLEKLTK